MEEWNRLGTEVEPHSRPLWHSNAERLLVSMGQGATAAEQG